MSLEGRIRGAIKQWDSEGHLSDDVAQEYAENAANVVKSDVEQLFSEEVKGDLLDDE